MSHVLCAIIALLRWTGRAFRPREIASMKVNKPRPSSRLPYASTGRPGTPASSGTPVLEVFVRPEAAGPLSGQTPQYLHQAVSLRLPTVEEVREAGAHQLFAACSVLPAVVYSP